MIKFNNIIQESELKELSSAYQHLWQGFESEDKDQIANELRNLLHGKWFYKFTNRKEQEIHQFFTKRPELKQYMQDAIREINGNSVQLYRGIGVSVAQLAKNEANCRLLLNEGDTVTIGTYKDYSLFSWSENLQVAQFFAKGDIKVILKSDMPIDQIIVSGLAVPKLDEKASNAAVHNEEYIVDHAVADIQAMVDSVRPGYAPLPSNLQNIEYGKDDLGEYMTVGGMMKYYFVYKDVSMGNGHLVFSLIDADDVRDDVEERDDGRKYTKMGMKEYGSIYYFYQG